MADKLSDMFKEINDLLEAVSKEGCRDKDYSVLEGMQKDSVSKLRTAFDKGYKQGYEAGVASKGFTDGYSEAEVERLIHDSRIAERNEVLAELSEKGKDAIENADKQGYERGIEQGRIEAWTAVQKIFQYGSKEMMPLFGLTFGTGTWETMFTIFSASKAIKKIEEYEQKQKQDKIKVGDVVKTPGGLEMAVFHIKDDKVDGIDIESGDYNFEYISDVTKTSRHFDQIEEVLEALKKG